MFPDLAEVGLILAHGADAGMRHAFMEALAVELANRGVASLRYQFPYMEGGRNRPDPPALCHATVRAAVVEANRLAPGLPLFAGGKSFGGRMTSQAQAASALPEVRGLVFVGFPLHPAGKPGSTRAEHLADVTIPMLFLQGTRDELASLALLEPVVAGLGSRARLQIVDDADHSFHVRARSGRKDPQVIAELAQSITDWAKGQLP
jgi:predicted alpha/beta-hydrolase family hydrolase